jgi:LysM repeat protein
MRARALDDDPMNDIASITVIREISPGRRTETDLDLNCRDFFARRLGTSNGTTTIRQTIEPSVIQTRVQTPAPTVLAPAPVAPTYNTYRVRRGDTLYGIARAHCTGWKTLAQYNNLPNAARIEPGQILRIPNGGC